MTSSQANPAYSSTTETSNPGNPMTAPGGTSYDDGAGVDQPREKLSFAERHKAPTTKDVETNRWVFGAQQGVSGPGDRRADGAGTDLGGLGPAGDGGNLTAGTAAGGTNDLGVGSGGRVTDAGAGTGMGGGQERYRDQQTTGMAAAGTGTVGDVGRGSTTGVYEGTAGYGDTSTVGEGYDGVTGSGTGTGTGTGMGTGTGVDDDEYEDDGAGGRKKKMNPLKKVVQAMKNV